MSVAGVAGRSGSPPTAAGARVGTRAVPAGISTASASGAIRTLPYSGFSRMNPAHQATYLSQMRKALLAYSRRGGASPPVSSAALPRAGAQSKQNYLSLNGALAAAAAQCRLGSRAPSTSPPCTTLAAHIHGFGMGAGVNGRRPANQQGASRLPSVLPASTANGAGPLPGAAGGGRPNLYLPQVPGGGGGSSGTPANGGAPPSGGDQSGAPSVAREGGNGSQQPWAGRGYSTPSGADDPGPGHAGKACFKNGTRITHNMGGDVDTFMNRAQSLLQEKKGVEIWGPCVSACVDMIAQLPKDKVCIGPNASLGFHDMSVNGEPDRWATDQMVSRTYPKELQDFWRKVKDARAPLDVKYMKGQDLASVYKPCSAINPACDAFSPATTGLEKDGKKAESGIAGWATPSADENASAIN